MQKRWIAVLSIIITLCLGLYLVNQFYRVPMEYQEAASDSLLNPIELPKEPQVLYGMVVDDLTVIEDKIKRNEVLGDILETYHVPA
ncbi:MAG TPA: hypothetical protein PKU83_06380, partial [Chryseolinea sp.]|nr:hypothetical protein [Chryseolinea sp.]